MKFLVMLALVASARAFSYTTGSAHPGYAYRTLAAPLGYATHYSGYLPSATAYRSYVAHPAANFNYGYSVAHHAPVATKVVTHAHEVATPVLKSVVAPVAHTVAAAAPTFYSHQTYAPSTTQYRQQNELGEYQFGYAADTSARDEIRTADGVVQGQYSYIDANNIPQKVNYVADALGFRVAGTNIPAAPAAAAVVAAHPVAPAVVEAAHVAPALTAHTVVKSALVDEVNPHVPYTAEVAAARADHLAALHTAAHAASVAPVHHVIAKRSADPAGPYGRRSYYGSYRGSSYGRRSGHYSPRSYARRGSYYGSRRY